MKFTRLIALGDSFTEGMSDEEINGHYRGWADRTADTLAITPGFTYLNLAIRGKLIGQVTRDQVPQALKYITGKETLVSYHAGANDCLRKNYDPRISIPQYEQGIRELAKSGATVLVFTIQEGALGESNFAKLRDARFKEFNQHVRLIAKEVGAILIEANENPLLADSRFMSSDRLHLNAEGHRRVSECVLENLGYEFDPGWKIALAPATKVSALKKLPSDAHWFATFALPWMWRRLRGKSSGDGRTSKQSKPVAWVYQR